VGEKLFTPAAGIVLALGIAMMINTNWLLLARFDIAVLLLVIVDMVVKPFAS